MKAPVALLLCLCLSLPALAQKLPGNAASPTSALADDIRFSHLKREDGLANDLLFYIYQDKSGFIWFFDSGFQRYDGREIKPSPNPGSIYAIKIGERLADWWGQEPDSLLYFDPTRDSTIWNMPQKFWFLVNEQAYPFLEFGCPNCFFQDDSDSIWLGSSTQGLFIYQRATKSFRPLQHREEIPSSLSSNNLSSLLRDSSGLIWAGTWNAGLNRWTGDSSFQHFSYIRNDPHSLWADTITCLMEGRQGIIWIGTTQGLNRLDPRTNAVTRISLPDHVQKRIEKIFQDRSGRLWLASADNSKETSNHESIVLYDPIADKVLEHFQNLGVYWNNLIFCLTEDHRGRIWMGGDGLYIYDPQTRKLAHYLHDPRNPWSLSSNIIRQLYRDNNNRIWVGSFNGVNMYDPNAKVFVHRESDREGKQYFNAELKYSNLEDRRGNIWMATRGAGLIKWNPRTDDIKVYTTSNGLATNDLLRIVEDDEGNIWMTGFGKTSFCVLDPHTDKITYLSDMDNLGALTKDGKGRIWAAGKKGILMYPDVGSTPTSFAWDSFRDSLGNLSHKLPLFNAFPWNMVEGRDGGLWISGQNFSLLKFDPATGSVRQFFHDPEDPNTLPFACALDFAKDRNGNLWLAVREGGLAFLPVGEQNSLKPRFRRWHTGNSSVPDDDLTGVIVDRNGLIWFASPAGVTRFDPVANTFTTYGRKEGLTTIPMALAQSKDGTIYLSGMNGIGYFHPDRLAKNNYPPPIYITDIQVNRHSLPLKGSPGDTLPFPSPLEQSVSFAKSIRLKHWQNEITLKFVALNYTAPKSNRYKYQLIGYDKDWKETDATQPFATYTNLAPRTYTFRVIGSNNDGVWNEKGATLRITILPPWYWAWWSKTLYLLAAGALILGVYRFNLRRQLALAEARRMRELDAVKTRLYTNISHEFRTPLTVIEGMAAQVREHPERWFREGLDLIVRNCRQLLHLVNQLLDLAKVEGGAMTLRLVQADIIPFLRYLLDSFHSLAETKNLRLHWQGELPALVMDFDPERLQQVMSNLLSNAIKFTPEGGDIYLDVRKHDEGGMLAAGGIGALLTGRPVLEIALRDTGIGIAADKLPHVFDRFYQVDDATTRKAEGSGIGLALTKELVRLMGGVITVESAVGEGTTFTVFLPVRQSARPSGDEFRPGGDRPPAELPTIQMAAPKPGEATTKRPQVLLVEDNADVLAYLWTCLQDEYELLAAANGRDGWEQAVESIPDLVVSDVMMPEMDGFELCAALKADERTCHIPVILLTARADADSRVEGLEQGADAYLAKPFEKRELLVRIRKLLELRRRLQEHYQAAMGLPVDGDSAAPVVAVEDPFVRRARETVEARLGDFGFGAAELSAALFLSPSQVNRKLNAVTGLPANRFIRLLRLQRAQELLRDRARTVAEVASDCGFLDPDYFARVFHLEVGMTPTEFREGDR